jgi:hypothetical protein
MQELREDIYNQFHTAHQPDASSKNESIQVSWFVTHADARGVVKARTCSNVKADSEVGLVAEVTTPRLINGSLYYVLSLPHSIIIQLVLRLVVQWSRGSRSAAVSILRRLTFRY